MQNSDPSNNTYPFPNFSVPLNTGYSSIFLPPTSTSQSLTPAFAFGTPSTYSPPMFGNTPSKELGLKNTENSLSTEIINFEFEDAWTKYADVIFTSSDNLTFYFFRLILKEFDYFSAMFDSLMKEGIKPGLPTQLTFEYP